MATIKTNETSVINITDYMQSPSEISQNIQLYLYDAVKIFLIIILILYAIIALFTLKQISLMTHTIKSDTNKYIYLIGYIHLAAVLLCLLFTVTVL